MTGVESLDRIADRESVENIQRITEEFVTKPRLTKIILFGSFANGTYNEESDFDFYIVIDDGRNVNETTRAAYRALINIKKDRLILLLELIQGLNKKENLIIH